MRYIFDKDVRPDDPELQEVVIAIVAAFKPGEATDKNIAIALNELKDLAVGAALLELFEDGLLMLTVRDGKLAFFESEKGRMVADQLLGV